MPALALPLVLLPMPLLVSRLRCCSVDSARCCWHSSKTARSSSSFEAPGFCFTDGTRAVHNEIMHRFTVSVLPLLALSLVHCNSPTVIIDVDIDYWPSEAKTLLLVTTLNGQPGKEQRISPDNRRLAIHLPADAKGTVTVRL